MTKQARTVQRAARNVFDHPVDDARDEANARQAEWSYKEPKHGL